MSDEDSAVRRWLEPRMDGAPEELRERMWAAISGVETDEVPRALAQAAIRCLDEALAQGGTRGGAGPLLAADALLTHACEAAAEMAGVGTVEEVAGVAPLSQRLEQHRA